MTESAVGRPLVTIVEPNPSLASSLFGRIREAGFEVVVNPSPPYSGLVVLSNQTPAPIEPTASAVRFEMPVKYAKLVAAIHAAASKQRLAVETPAAPVTGPMIIGSSPAIQHVKRDCSRVAKKDATVLITGETGTGKGLFAELIHHNSARTKYPFVTVNCAGIPTELLESEMFGHAKGSFTGAVADRAGLVEAANGGTLFLDEIGDMPMSTQAKLLHFMERSRIRRVGENRERQIDVRIIAATHQPLEQNIAQGLFRRDLYFRLFVFSVHIPPLRTRPEDVRDLARHQLARMSEKDNTSYRFGAGVFPHLESHKWPGNVRELQHTIERATILAENQMILPRHFPSITCPPNLPTGAVSG